MKISHNEWRLWKKFKGLIRHRRFNNNLEGKEKKYEEIKAFYGNSIADIEYGDDGLRRNLAGSR